jgi:acetolactate synthase I/II/III large subunit
MSELDAGPPPETASEDVPEAIDAATSRTGDGAPDEPIPEASTNGTDGAGEQAPETTDGGDHEPIDTPDALTEADDPDDVDPGEAQDVADAAPAVDEADLAHGGDLGDADESADADALPDATSAPDAPDEVTVPAGPRTVGRFIAEALRAAGVRYAFTVPGESFLGLLDALGDAGIRVVATRHEGGAAFMAEAHGQLTGRPAACLATRAVGGANLAIGIHTAKQDSSPMFALVGQVERAFRGREAFQEIDQVTTLGGLAKWAVEPRRAEDVPAAMAQAVREALTGRPGPVLISLPEDLLDEVVDLEPADAARPSPARATPDEIRSVIELLASARRPVILAGAGVLRARTSTELTKFAELLHVPVISAWRRADVISNDHPLYLGMAGLGSPASTHRRLEAADALLVIGSRLNEATTYGYTMPAAGSRWAHVDLVPSRSGDLPAAELAVTSDARSFLRAANERLLSGAALDAERVAARDANNAADRASWEADTIVDATPWDGPGVHPGRTITTLRRLLPDEAIVTTDAGNFGAWAARGFRFRRPGTYLGPTSGAMGYGLPAAIAAALVHRDRPVVALVGDGGLAMTMSELETAVRESARVVVIVFDNERYGTIRMHQDQRGTGEGVATDLGPVDFAAIARAMGGRGIRVDTDEAFEPAVRAALAADRLTVIQLALDRRWVSVDQPAV